MHSSSWCSAPPPAPRWLSWKMVAARLFSKIPTFMLRILPAWIVPLEIHPDLFFRTFCVAKKYKNFPLRCVGMFSQQTIRRVWSKVFLSEWRLGVFLTELWSTWIGSRHIHTKGLEQLMRLREFECRGTSSACRLQFALTLSSIQHLIVQLNWFLYLLFCIVLSIDKCKKRHSREMCILSSDVSFANISSNTILGKEKERDKDNSIFVTKRPRINN